MSQSTARAEAIAHELIAWFRSRSPDASSVDAAVQVTAALHSQVGVMVGEHGFRLLVARAVTRAARQYPPVAEVRAVGDNDRFLTGLDAAVQASGEQEAAAAAHAIIAELVGLLMRFFGDEIALRLIRQSVPDATLGSTLHSEDAP